jgi:hypothetical protein
MTKGKPWRCFADGRAPVLAMTPTGEQSARVWGEWQREVYPALAQMGIDGTHTPLKGELIPSFRQSYRDNSERGLATAAWCVFENDGGPAAALAVVRALVALYDSTSNPGPMIVGPTWDVWQAEGWEQTATVNGWITDAQSIVGARNIMIGARARRNPETGAAEQEYVGDYAAYEAHVADGQAADAVFAGAIQQAGGVPVAEFDRFRVRSRGAGKDMTNADMPLVCRASRARRVAIIIGHDSDTGSRPFGTAAQIRRELVGQNPPPPPDPPPPPAPPPEPLPAPAPDDGGAPPGKTIEDIMADLRLILDPITPIIEQGLVLAGKLIDERASEREFAKFLLEKAVDTEQINTLIQQAIDERAIHIRNMTWLQTNVADKLGDFFDGDLIEKIRGAL